jgi:hypothetical protein
MVGHHTSVIGVEHSDRVGYPPLEDPKEGVVAEVKGCDLVVGAHRT